MRTLSKLHHQPVPGLGPTIPYYPYRQLQDAISVPPTLIPALSYPLDRPRHCRPSYGIWLVDKNEVNGEFHAISVDVTTLVDVQPAAGG
jgi:hypothetical protein